MKALRHKIPLAAAALLLLGLGVGAGMVLAQGSAPSAIRNQIAAAKNPLGAKGRTLGLSRVIIPAGAVLPPHFHDGTQAVYIQSGAIRYHVITKSVTVMNGLADQNPTFVRNIKAGQTATVRAGDWFVEQPTEHHSASTTQKAVVLQATLLKNGAPPATPVTRHSSP